MIRYLIVVLLFACDSAEPIACDDLECEALSCGTVTPHGVEHPERCTCSLPNDGGFVGCEVSQ